MAWCRHPGQRYHLSVFDPDLNGWLTSSGEYTFRFNSSEVQLGDIDLRSFIRSHQNKIYRMAAEAQIYLDDIPAQTVPRILEGILETLWLHAGRDIKPPIDTRQNTLLNRQSTNALNGLLRDFPGLMRTMLEYFTVENVISSKADQEHDSVILELRVRFNQEAFAKDFPEIENLLRELKDSVFFRIRLHDEHDRLMGMMELDSIDKEFLILLRIRRGGLLPLTDQTADQNKSSFSLTGPGYQQYYIAYDIHLNLVGLRLNIQSLPIAVEYMNRDQELDIKVCLWQPPEIIETGGRAFGFIPLWLVNALIPSNVEEITTNFFRALALGNDGGGTYIGLESRGVREIKNHIHLQAGTEVLGNGTIKLAFNIRSLDLPILH